MIRADFSSTKTFSQVFVNIMLGYNWEGDDYGL